MISVQKIHMNLNYGMLVQVQPVPWKMRLEMVNEMKVEILNGGKILVNCNFKLNKIFNLNLYREIPRNSNPIRILIRLFTVRYRRAIDFLDFD